MKLCQVSGRTERINITSPSFVYSLPFVFAVHLLVVFLHKAQTEFAEDAVSIFFTRAAVVALRARWRVVFESGN